MEMEIISAGMGTAIGFSLVLVQANTYLCFMESRTVSKTGSMGLETHTQTQTHMYTQDAYSQMQLRMTNKIPFSLLHTHKHTLRERSSNNEVNIITHRSTANIQPLSLVKTSLLPNMPRHTCLNTQNALHSNKGDSQPLGVTSAPAYYGQ